MNQDVDFVDVLPEDFVVQLLSEANSQEEAPEELSVAEGEIDKTKPTIKLTTFEGAKGLSAQHVFILGLQNGDLPKNPSSILDIEVCKFLVALTRTRKQCHLMTK